MRDAREGLIRFSRMALAASYQSSGTPRAGLTLLHHVGPSSGGGNQLVQVLWGVGHAGIVNCSPRESTAQAIRAFFAAMATIARQ